jgi:hypothetical protein
MRALDPTPKYYAYTLFHPLHGYPCYVGKGQDDRWWRSATFSKNRRLKALIAKYGRGNVPVVIVCDGLPEAEALNLEIELIRAIGRADQGRGPLFNNTDGGEGGSGIIIPPAVVAARNALNRGKKRTLESVEASASKRRGVKRSEEFRQQISEMKVGVRHWVTPDGEYYHAKEAKSPDDRIGDRPKSEETKKKISEQQQGIHWWTRPNGTTYRAKERKSSNDVQGRPKRGPMGPEFSAKNSIAQKGLRFWITPFGVCYKAREPRSSEDVIGMPSRGPMAKETKSKIGEGNRGKVKTSQMRINISNGKKAAAEARRRAAESAALADDD